MVKKLLWTALVTTLTSIASGLAFRAAAEIWRMCTKETPPKSGLAGYLVKRPVKKKLLALLHAPAP